MAAEQQGIRSSGTVKWFSAQRGFGFISPDGSGADDEDLFVHQTAIRSDGFRTLSEGQPVQFAVELAEDGRAKAVDVSALGRARRFSGRGGGRSRGSFFNRGGARGRGGRGGGVGEACYNCGRIGHFARDCYRGGGGGNTAVDHGGDRSGGGGRSGGACFNCGELGHFARDCPNIEQK